ICYIYTTQYEGLLPGPELLVPKSEASFLPATLGNSAFMGGGSSTAKVDTAVNNDLLVQTALQEAINNKARGLQFQFIPQEEFIDSMGNLKAEMVETKFDPDIIIKLCDLTLVIAGDANKGVSVMTSQPMMEMPGEYSSIS